MLLSIFAPYCLKYCVFKVVSMIFEINKNATTWEGGSCDCWYPPATHLTLFLGSPPPRHPHRGDVEMLFYGHSGRVCVCALQVYGGFKGTLRCCAVNLDS